MGRNVKNTNLETEHMPTPGVLGRKITVADAVIDLGKLHGNTQYVWLQVQDQPIQVTFDGSDPAASTGFLYPATTFLKLSARMAAAAKLIRATGSSGAVYVQECTR